MDTIDTVVTPSDADRNIISNDSDRNTIKDMEHDESEYKLQTDNYVLQIAVNKEKNLYKPNYIKDKGLLVPLLYPNQDANMEITAKAINLLIPKDLLKELIKDCIYEIAAEEEKENKLMEGLL